MNENLTNHRTLIRCLNQLVYVGGHSTLDITMCFMLAN